MNKFWTYAIYVVVSLMAILTVFNLYQTFYPFKTVTISNAQSLTVLTPRVKAGEDLIYQVEYCRNTGVPAKIYRNLIGPDRIPTAITESVMQPGCKQAQSHLTVPVGATPGTYHMEARADFQISPSRIISVTYQTQNFEVYK